MSTQTLSKIILEGREFLIKRDDLFDPYLSGNKFRKLHTLINTPKQNLKKIISYGGTQSNAMLALAKLCHDKEWEFVYYTKAISATLKKQKVGNLFLALGLGMHHIEIDDALYRDFIATLRLNLDAKTFIVDQGGADRSAKEGLAVLAEEIRSLDEEIEAIATPSGTGTTALYLALALPEKIVYTVPCVGDTAYLQEQMSALHPIPENLIILEPKKKYHFAKLYLEFLEIYAKLLESGVEFDLLYAPSLWLSLLEEKKEKVLYVHSGGVSGNESMLERYRAKAARSRKN